MRSLYALSGCLLACVFAIAPAFAQNADLRIESPGIRVGDTWMYNKINGWNGGLEQVSVNVVKQSDRSGILMESSGIDGGSVATVRRSASFNLVRIDEPGYSQTAEPFYPNFSFPLYAGKTWMGKVVLSNSKQPGTSVTAELQGTAVGWELVTVPAGTFLALKLSMKGNYAGSGLDGNWGGTIEDTLWYAPEVRNAVRYEYRDFSGTKRHNHDIHELVRFWPGP
ncbi:MAG: hypothetical protein EXR27_14150 [Betaproteobacteria bacterium]|nr:hypothetical protein [Betaproteobacteria bacterium]